MRRPITTFAALLALSLISCANPKPDSIDGDSLQNGTTQVVDNGTKADLTKTELTKTDPAKTDTTKTDVTPTTQEDPTKLKDNTKKSDSIVLSTLKVEPTPGLATDAKGFRQRGAGHGGGFFGGRGGYEGESAGVAYDAVGGGPAPTMARPMEKAPAKPMAEAPMPAPPPGAMKDKASISGGDGGAYYQTQSALKAGEVDDNKNFDDYLSYLKKKEQLGGVAKVDVSKRIQLNITDSAGKPVHDAKVTLEIDGKPWLRAKSHTNGGLVFFPYAAGALPQGKATIKVEKGDATFSKELAGFSANEKITLAGANATQGVARLDLVFCIDTTGSMGDEIAQIQSTVQEIITKTKNLPAKPELRMGMVLYGDRGDVYTTRVYDFTTDAEKFKTNVASIEMTGGGDTPEDLNSGIEDSIESLEWNNQESARLVFVIGDAAPHMDYQQKYDYKVASLRAAEQGIKIFPLASSGLEDVGEYVFRQMALFTEANFLFLTYGANGDTTTMNVERDNYTPDKLDDVIVKRITEELKPLAAK